MTTTTTVRTRRALLFPEPTEIVPGKNVWEVHAAKVIDIPITGDGSTLREMQNLVRGNIEAVVMPLDHSGYINEEGKLCEPPMPLNVEADSLWKRAVREGGMVHQPGDYLGGPVVITGPLDEEGYDTDVTDEFIALVRSMAIQIDEAEKAKED